MISSDLNGHTLPEHPVCLPIQGEEHPQELHC